MSVISCHADTGYPHHCLERLEGGILRGHLDNFSGVYAVMKAFFSGRLTHDYVRIELTYGEETDMAGAHEVRKTLKKRDLVVVVDVTGTPTTSDFVIEKCRNKAVRTFLEEALAGMAFDLYKDCPDPVADQDETDVYSEKCKKTFFLGVPCTGGDYNAGAVVCQERSLDAIADAICRLADAFPEFCRKQGDKVK